MASIYAKWIALGEDTWAVTKITEVNIPDAPTPALVIGTNHVGDSKYHQGDKSGVMYNG
jgi:hypothetical protein